MQVRSLPRLQCPSWWQKVGRGGHSRKEGHKSNSYANVKNTFYQSPYPEVSYFYTKLRSLQDAINGMRRSRR